MSRPKDIETAEGQRRHEAKYQRILDAALDVFAHKGFAEAKISEVARLAGVADGTIYLYFKNKDDLLISLFESKLEAINLGLRQELASIETARDKLCRIMDYHLRLAVESPTLAVFMTIELRSSAKFVKDYAKGQFAEYLEQWAQVIRDGKERGEFRDDVRPGVVKHMLFGALDQICVTWVNSPERKPEELQAIAEHLRALVLRAVAV